MEITPVVRESDKKISLVQITTPNYANQKIKKLRRIYIFSGSKSLKKIETILDSIIFHKQYYFLEDAPKTDFFLKDTTCIISVLWDLKDFTGRRKKVFRVYLLDDGRAV